VINFSNEKDSPDSVWFTFWQSISVGIIFLGSLFLALALWPYPGKEVCITLKATGPKR